MSRFVVATGTKGLEGPEKLSPAAGPREPYEVGSGCRSRVALPTLPSMLPVAAVTTSMGSPE